MGNLVAKGPTRFADRASQLLKRVQYRRIDTEVEKEAVFRQRYEAYLREGGIDPSDKQIFHDSFDQAPNVWIVGLFVDGELASSMRIHVASKEGDVLPAAVAFPDAVLPHLRAGKILVDTTRFVTSPDFSRRYPQLPVLAIRTPWMAAEYFQADTILATLREEHIAFYMRSFGHTVWTEPRTYPSLNKPIACLGMDRIEQTPLIYRQHPYYRSTASEREALFTRSSNGLETPQSVVLALHARIKA